MGAGAMPGASRVDSDLREGIDGILADHLARGAAPSAAWGVFDREGPAWFSSAGLLSSGSPPSHDTVYRIASCTKSFTAAAVLALRDAGRFGLDEPITRFVPDFDRVTLPTADSPMPTIRMLLTMSAGFPTDDPWADRQESSTAEEFDSLLAHGLSFESVPGTRFSYSNLGYALLGRVIEQASGQGYREYVRDAFLQPLGLSSTGFDASVVDAAGTELALGHRWVDSRWEALPLSAPGAFSPIGGLFTTVSDLCRWAGWLAEAFAPEAPGANGPLSRASRREMQQLHRLAPEFAAHPTGYGFGLFSEQYSTDELVVSHSGGYPGYSAHMRWSASRGLGIVAVENATYSRVSVPATEAFDLLLAAQKPMPLELWPETRVAQQAVIQLIRAGFAPDAVRSASVAEDALFSDNIELDESWDRRRANLTSALARIGGLADETEPVGEESSSPAHLTWMMPGNTGGLRVEIRLNPQHPPRIQTLKITPDRVE